MQRGLDHQAVSSDDMPMSFAQNTSCEPSLVNSHPSSCGWIMSKASLAISH
jgi:hypothetical protein